MTCTRSTRRSTSVNASCNRASGTIKLMIAALAVILGVFVLTGCSDDPAGPGEVTGDYVLTLVDQKSVPATFTDAAGSTLTINAGTMEMLSNGEFVYNIRGKINSYSFDYDDWGTFKISGKKVTFDVDSDDAGHDFTGTISGNVITIDYPVAGVKFAMNLNKK